MRPHLILIEVSQEEQSALDEAVNSSDSYRRRRAQMLRLSAEGISPQQIASGLDCSEQTVRNAIHAFVNDGISSLSRQKMGPKNPTRVFDAPQRERLMGIAHQSPRLFGKARSEWTLALLASVCYEQKLTEQQVCAETIRKAILAMGSSWDRARHWITSPDPQYAIKKSSVRG